MKLIFNNKKIDICIILFCILLVVLGILNIVSLL